jgi:hypothetical protein
MLDQTLAASTSSQQADRIPRRWREEAHLENLDCEVLQRDDPNKMVIPTTYL